jgi:hypothetical protein
MSLVSGEKSNFQFILRLLNTNVDGKQKVMYALTKIKGVGRRYSNLVCKKADVDLNKRYDCLPIPIHTKENFPRFWRWLSKGRGWNRGSLDVDAMELMG